MCTENDDPTAQRQAQMFAKVGVAPRDITPWNAYPWYVNRVLTAAERQAGVEPLLRLIDLMPRLRVVLLQGRDAQDGWKRVVTVRPRLVRDRCLTVVATYHPGRQALWSPDPKVRAARAQHRRDAYERVVQILC